MRLAYMKNPAAIALTVAAGASMLAFYVSRRERQPEKYPNFLSQHAEPEHFPSSVVGFDILRKKRAAGRAAQGPYFV